MDLVYMLGWCGVLYYLELGLLYFGAVWTWFEGGGLYGGYLSNKPGLFRIHQC